MKFAEQIKAHLNQDRLDDGTWKGQSGQQKKAAAVLFPFYFKAGEPWVLLTQRNAELKHHSGQVSFPGGGYETQDKHIRATAIRETEEEIGIQPNDIEIWGHLDPLPSISGFAVTPFVGELKSLDDMRIDENEVAKVFGVPFAFFQDGNNRTKHKVRTPVGDRHYYVYDHNGDVIWGLTAQIIVQLVERMKT